VDVAPQLDLDYIDTENRKVHYNYQEISNNRLIKNALHKSHFFRSVSLNVIDEQLENAVELLKLINLHLSNEK